MLKAKLEEYKKKNKLSWDEVAAKLGLSRRGLINIFEKRSPHTLVITCMKIEALTGLSPWQYLDGLDKYKKLINKKDEKSS